MLFLILILCFFSFFWGRVFEFFVIEKRNYSVKKRMYSIKLLREKEKQVSSIANYFQNNNVKRIVVYGLGLYYNNFMERIKDCNFENIYLADGNALCKQEEFLEKVYTKSELLCMDFDVIVVVAATVYYESIKEELKLLGIEKDIIAYSDLIYNDMKE